MIHNLHTIGPTTAHVIHNSNITLSTIPANSPLDVHRLPMTDPLNTHIHLSYEVFLLLYSLIRPHKHYLKIA